MSSTSISTISSSNDSRAAGIAGVLVGALSLIMVPLYFVYSGPPPADNVLTRTLITVAVFTIFIPFVLGMRRLAGGAGGLAADVAVGSGLAYAVITLVATSMEAGVALEFPDGSKDPTIDGPLANGMALLHGPIARALIATFLISLAMTVIRTRILPGWVAKGSIAIAVLNLAFVPSLFFGMDPANFYAANGWGSTASIGSVFMLWTGAVGIALLRSARGSARRSARRPVEAPGEVQRETALI